MMQSTHDSSNVHAGVVAAALTAIQDFAHGPLIQLLMSVVIGIAVGQINRLVNAMLSKKEPK
jgi:hypothetical protein